MWLGKYEGERSKVSGMAVLRMRGKAYEDEKGNAEDERDKVWSGSAGGERETVCGPTVLRTRKAKRAAW